MANPNQCYSPKKCINEGYDVHVVFQTTQLDQARELFEDFLAYVDAEQIPHQRAIIFERPVGPWPTPMWQILLRGETATRDLERDLGKCLAWLMINRRGFSVMVHPNTLTVGEFGGGYMDHKEYATWIGPSMELKLDIFRS
jgi:aromatic ring-cleaving dioxygenase